MSKPYEGRSPDGPPLRVDDAQASPNSTRFRVRAKLGRGGTGTVVRAYDRESGVDVALKSILRAEGDALLRFKREFRALRDVRHPNLVELIELIERDGEWLYTMELVNGVEPLEYVRAGSLESGTNAADFDEARLRSLLVQLASGLDALHRRGMVHRDVKPSNVLVTEGGRAVLLDFGLVASAYEAFQSTDVPTAGTVCYMAPEQGLGMPVAPASDWYAFGVLLFEALTGRAPYEGMTLEILLAKAQRAAREPRELVPSVPDDLNRLCARLLSVDPADRPSGSDVLACLAAAPGTRESGEPRGGETIFVGRARELAALRAAADRAFDGAHVTVRISGAGGVGKTGLVGALVHSLRESHPDLLVLRGRCDPRERVPYQGLDGILDGVSSHLRKRGATQPALSSAVLRLSRIFPVLRRVPSVRAAHANEPLPCDCEGELAEIACALRTLLSSLAASSPTLLVVEHVQWLDHGSREVLAELTRPPSAPHVLVITTRRSEEGDEGAADLELAPLAHEEAEALVRRRCARRAGPADLADFAAIAREAEGNPLFVEELVELAAREVSAAPTFDHFVASRLGALDEAGRSLLELCAVHGRSVRRSALVTASGRPAADVHRDLRALVAERLLRVTSGGERLDVFHPRIAASIQRRLAPALVRSLRARLAD